MHKSLPLDRPKATTQKTHHFLSPFVSHHYNSPSKKSFFNLIYIRNLGISFNFPALASEKGSYGRHRSWEERSSSPPPPPPPPPPWSQLHKRFQAKVSQKIFSSEIQSKIFLLVQVLE